MKHTKEELEEKRFFKTLNLITKNFLSKQIDLDLAQFEALATNGKIDVQTVVHTFSTNNVLHVIKTFTYKDADISVIQVIGDIKGDKLYDLLDSGFEPLLFSKKLNEENLRDLVEETITPNRDIYFKQPTEGSQRSGRYPRMFSWVKPNRKMEVLPVIGITRLFVYRPNLGYSYKESEMEEYDNRTYVLPPLFSERTLIIVGKKKQLN